jgi:hypothetical protein
MAYYFMFKGSDCITALPSLHQHGSTVTSSHGNLIPRGGGSTCVPSSWARRHRVFDTGHSV